MAAPQPTLAGFILFIQQVMRVPPKALPISPPAAATSPFVPWAFANALAIVNPALANVGIPSTDAASVQLTDFAGNPLLNWTVYALAVYNLAADGLINFTIDQPGTRYFANLRKKLNITGFVSGVVQSTGDESTNVSMVVQEAAKEFTLQNLQNMKTSYGRVYLSLAQSYGPTTWGMS